MNENKTNINYYPGHMAKTKRLISEKLPLIDIVYELVDARIPLSSKIDDINSITKGKIRILVMTKKDLCNIEETNKWVNYYKNNGYEDVLLLDIKNDNDYKKLFEITKKHTEYIQAKRKEKGLLPKEIKALVIGIPNVGKSTLINKMVGKNVVKAENKPGVTKHLSFLPTKMGVTLLDTPGILWPKFEDQNIAKKIAIIGSIKKEVLNLYDVVEYLFNIFNEKYPHIITDYYKLEIASAQEEIENLAKMLGYVNGEDILYSKVCEKVYNDVVGGKVSNFTLDICK